MILSIKDPTWITELQYSPACYASLKDRLKAISSDDPKLTVCVIARNEERTIARCLDSLSRSRTTVPFDILVVNNNSSDRTQEILDDLGVTSYFQASRGCGAARNAAQKNAKGKYILLADADCIYPRDWVQIMYQNLRKKGVVAVYGRHSFLGDRNVPRWKYALYDLVKDFVHGIRNINRPYLNAYGMTFGYIKKLGLKEGFATKHVSGEDGRLCFDLMKYGKIKQVRNNKSRVWTEARNFDKDGGLNGAVKKRVLRELIRISDYFKKPMPHDTKVSENYDATADEYKKQLLNRFKKMFKTHSH